MNWILRFLGFYDTKQEEISKDVSDYVGNKKVEFHKEMRDIKRQAILVHRKTRQAHLESIKLNKVVDDIARKIAIATGGMK